jgi:hypothetical protein
MDLILVQKLMLIKKENSLTNQPKLDLYLLIIF